MASGVGKFASGTERLWTYFAEAVADARMQTARAAGRMVGFSHQAQLLPAISSCAALDRRMLEFS